MAKSSFEGIIRISWPQASKGKHGHKGGPPTVMPLIVPLDLIELGALDLWIEDQPGRKLSRPQAARKLINEALVGK